MIHLDLKNTKTNPEENDLSYQLPKRKVTWGRISLHVLYWAWNSMSSYTALERQLRVNPQLPPEPDILAFVMFIHLSSTMIVFYLFGYLVVPKLMIFLLHQRATNKYLWGNFLFFLVSFVAMFLVFNMIDYYMFTYVFDHFKPVPGYVDRIHTILSQNGRFGVFKDYFMFTFVWGYNFSYVLLPLLIRMIREAISWGVVSIEQQEENRVLISNQLKLLQSQINPHFLFNVFNNIYGLIQRTNTEAAKLLHKLSKLLNYTLYETKDRFVSLEEELTFTRNYVDIEQTRNDHPEKIRFIIDGLCKDYRVPPLILVTFIENAFKHGLNNSFDEGYVDIVIKIDETRNKLQTQVKNYVTDEHPTKIVKGGVGLLNARKRLDLLFGSKNYFLRTELLGHEYQVDLEIPLKKSIEYTYEK